MSEALVIFARYPRLGTVKTRLAREIGKKQALHFYEASLLDTLERFSTLSAQLFLFLADSTRSEGEIFLRRYGLQDSWQLRLQEGGSLGERLWKAYSILSASADRIVFVGADSPTLPLSFVSKAFRQLLRFPLVLGPGRDGGYCLIGLSEAIPEVFQGVSWGTPKVLEQTRANLADRRWYELPQWYDVDDSVGLQALHDELLSHPDPPPRTAFVLKAWKSGELPDRKKRQQRGRLCSSECAVEE